MQHLSSLLLCWSVTAVLIHASAHEAAATPRMSLTAGTPCSGCHYSPNGGGGRTDLGWSSMSKVGAITYDQIGLKALHDQHSNMVKELVSVGFDMRVQGAHLGEPTYQGQGTTPKIPEYGFFPMQFQPYLAIKPLEKLTIYGSVLPGPNSSEGDITTHRYPGMSSFEWWASYSFGATAPQLRVGKFQPTFGIRHDDHTMLIRNDALTRQTPMIPPNFTEVGAELSYQPKRWLRAEVGGFNTRYLRESFDTRVEEISIPSYAVVSRLTFLPQFSFTIASDKTESAGDDDFGDAFGDDAFGDDAFGDDAFGDGGFGGTPVTVNTWFGISSYYSGQFHLLNGFMGAGMSNGLSMVAELSFRDNPNQGQKTYQQLNSLVGLNYAWRDWLVLNARVERGQTEYLTETLDEVAVAWQYVAGLEFFPLPYLEVRPEYRVVDTYDYIFDQLTVQVHLFY